MKRTLIVAGGYLIVGALSCAVLSSVASGMTENPPPSVKMVEEASGSNQEAASATGGETPAEEVKPKRRRGRKPSAKDGAKTEKRERACKRERANSTPRKPRARRSKKSAEPAVEAKQEGAAQ